MVVALSRMIAVEVVMNEWQVSEYIEAVEDLLIDWMWSESRMRVNSRVFIWLVGFYV